MADLRVLSISSHVKQPKRLPLAGLHQVPDASLPREGGACAAVSGHHIALTTQGSRGAARMVMLLWSRCQTV